MTPVLAGRPVSEPVEYYSFSRESVKERALFGEVSRELAGWRISGGGRWFGYHIATGNLTEFPYTPAYNSPYEAFDTDDSGVLPRSAAGSRSLRAPVSPPLCGCVDRGRTRGRP